MKGHALTLSADIGDEKVKAAGIMADGKNLSFINGKKGHLFTLRPGQPVKEPVS